MSRLIKPKQITSGNENYILTTSGGTTEWVAPSSISLASKFASDSGLTANVTATIVHNLGSTDVVVQVKSPTGELVTPRTVNNYTTTSVDINVSLTGTYRIIIIG